MLKAWLAVSLALNAAFVGMKLAPLLERGHGHRVYSPFHVQRSAVFEGLPVARGSVLFFGDSLIENCEWSELGLPAANRGISGDDTAALLAVVPSLGGLRDVNSIFVVAGINDLGEGIEGDAFVARYRALVSALHNAAPNARIVVHSILPVNPSMNDSLRPLPAKILAANARLSSVATDIGFRFLDGTSTFADSKGLMDGRYTVDGLHLNGAGYQAWAKALRPALDSQH
jgi:lysophospholipase L1-like esterase